MEDFKYCKACLAIDVKMFRLDTTSSVSIGTVYTQLSQIPIYSANQHVCFECASLLHKYNQFKLKCQRSHNILYDVIHQGTVQLSKPIIKNIDRKLNNLTSNLAVSPAVLCYNKPLSDKDDKDAMVKLIENHDTNIPMVEVKFETPANMNMDCESSFGEVLDIDAKIKSDDEQDYFDTNDISAGTDFHDDTYPVSSDEDIPLKLLKHKSKAKSIKEPRAKKRKKVSTDKVDTKKAVTQSIAHNLDYGDESLKECLDDLFDKNMEYSSEDSLLLEISKARHKIKPKKCRKSENDNESKPLSNGDKPKNVNSRNGKMIDLSFFEKHANVEFLTAEDAIREVLLRKESKNYKVSSFRCDLCYRGYGVKAAFENHMKKHTIECGEYECEFCHVRYTKRLRLAKHTYACHKTKISCKMCPYVCFCPRQARLHIKVHKGKKYPCPDCGHVFSMPHSLVQHRRKHQASRPEVVCEHCGSIFTSPNGLFVHCNQLHRESKIEKNGPKCDECNVHFSSEAAWKRHLVLSSKHIVSNGCKDCGEMFTSAEQLRLHMKVHARVEVKKCDTIKFPAPCSICDRWVSTRKDHRAHVTSEHPDTELARRFIAEELAPKPYVCEVCGHGFPKKSFLTYHQRKHTGERPYKCTQCDKAYWHPSALGSHKKMHRQRELFPCDTCGSVLLSSSALLKHRKNHINLRPHKCVICEKGFLNPSDLATHVKHVHDKVPYPKRKTKRTNKLLEYGAHE